jgi:hypothetical protein
MSWSALLFLGEDVLSQTAGWKTELHDAEAPFWRFGNIFSIFCGKMLDGGVEKAHKAVRANELATSERATGKEIFPDGKKVLDAGLKMRHKSPSRQRVAPTGPRKKTFAKMKKNLLTAKTKRRKQLLHAEWIGVVHWQVNSEREGTLRFWFPSNGDLCYRFELESLILAQIERWRRA